MFRIAENDLLKWKDRPNRKPLMIRGSRQVGKSYLVENFGAQYFQHTLIINFELDSRFAVCFEQVDPHKIIASLELITQQDIQPGKTLLFLDEIQLCPKAIIALRYFKEKMPMLHVIAAGSFLELVLPEETYKQPIGRVESLYLRPCSFKEFLIADNNEKLLQHLSTVTSAQGIDPALHDLLLEKCRIYFILGGMPEVLDYYFSQKKLIGAERIHASILEYYRRDLIKYGKRLNSMILDKLFVKAPGLIAKHFKYVDIDPDISAREQKPVLNAMLKAGIIDIVYQTSATGLPLHMTINEKKFKLLFMDLGLAQHALQLDPATLLQENLSLINQGDLAEQFVGQELLAYSPAYEDEQLFFWERDKKNAQAEVDFVIHHRGKIYPIEVKSGAGGRLRSLKIFMEEKNCIGIQISQKPLSFENNILSLPLYMIFELSRLLG